MSVRGSLLAILDQGPCYGYQLRAEFDRRTGSVWPLNVGQVYNTLDRLEREGLVAKGEADENGHVYWEITDAGRAGVRAWLAAPIERAQGSRDELAVKVAVAATLPGADVAGLVRAQRRAVHARLAEAAGPAQSGSPASDPDSDSDSDPVAFARSVVADAVAFHAEAELRWLDHIEQRLALHPPQTMALGLSTDKPRRGRPARAAASAS